MAIFSFFNDGLLKSAMAAMADGFTSTNDLPPYVLDGLLDSFSGKSLSMLTIETTMMLVNLATKPEAKRILTVGVFSNATRTSVIMNVMV